MAMQIDEVEQLRIMYSQFFRYNSAIQAELELHRNFTQEDIGKVLKKKMCMRTSDGKFGLREQKMVETMMQSKLAMVYQVEESVNLLGPKHLGEMNSWWNTELIQDDAQIENDKE